MQELQIEIVYSRYLSTLLFASLLKCRGFEKGSENINELLKSLIIGMSDGKIQLSKTMVYTEWPLTLWKML
ncbi:hypothetical protein ACGO3R_10060 [Lactococcus lactis]